MRGFTLNRLLFAMPLARVLARTPSVRMNVLYQCQPPYSFKLYSCSGTNANDQCDVQSFNGGRPFQRGKSTYQQVTALPGLSSSGVCGSAL